MGPLTAEMWRHPTAMEPLLPGGDDRNLAELTTTITFYAGHLSGSCIPQKTKESIEGVVQQINSYYSNLIEGHKTNPLEVERALKNDYSKDPKKRAMQRLGVAHIQTEERLKQMLRENPKVNIWSQEFSKTIHREFYSRLPAEFHIVKDSKGKEYKIVPGEYRDFNVDVGRHIPPDHPYIPAFMHRFETFYGNDQILSSHKLVAIAASHHRFAWLHPFGDGNGRVARLLAHAAFMQNGLDGFGLWTLARGLARRRDDYYSHLELADSMRLNDLDGRGNLSSKYLTSFCVFFLEVILDQIQFMASAIDYDNLKHRITNYVFRNNIFGKQNERGLYLLLEALHEGEYPRGEAPRITGYKETVARGLLQIALAHGLLVSDGPRSPVRLGFPNEVLEDYFPKLYMPLG